MKILKVFGFILLFSFLAVGCKDVLDTLANTIGYNFRGTFDNSAIGVTAEVDGTGITFSGNFNGVNIRGHGKITRKKYLIASTSYVNDYFLHDINKYIRKYILYMSFPKFKDEDEKVPFAYFPDVEHNNDVFYVYGLDGQFVRIE